MAETITQRTDADIDADIDHIIRTYPPLTNDRPFLKIDVTDRQVTLGGYTRTGVTRKYLKDAVQKVAGVTSVNTEGLHSDDQIRLDVGQKMPAGVNCNVIHGVVVLTIPADESADELVKVAETVPGVRAVRTQPE